MITAVYEAFISTGAPEDKAKAAAKADAEYDSRFNRIDSRSGSGQGGNGRAQVDAWICTGWRRFTGHEEFFILSEKGNR